MLSDQINETLAVRGCITILKEPKTKVCLCTNHVYGFTRIPENFPEYVAELTIENQKINALDSSQLKNLPHLVNLTLNNNKLSQVDADSFVNVPQLLTLKFSGNQLFLKDSSFPSKSLVYLKALKILDLSKNPLGYIPDYYFQSLKLLNVLILSGAQKGFFVEDKGFYGLSNLQVLDLSQNHLTTLSESLSVSFSSMQLQEFYLYQNPWNCDCNLGWLRMWFTKFKNTKFSKDFRKDNKFVNSIEPLIDIQPKCIEPINARGKNLLSNFGDTGSIGIIDFKCPPKIFTKDHKIEIFRGQNLTLTCDLHANPGDIVVWSKNGLVVQKHWPRVSWSTSQGTKFKAFLNVIDAEESDSGNWRCILTNNAGKVSATFTVKVASLTSQINYKYILKYVGIGAVTIVLLLVVIGIIIYCIYGFQIQNNRRRKPSTQEKVILKVNSTERNNTAKNYRMISRENVNVHIGDKYYNPIHMGHTSSIIKPCIDESQSPFSHYLVNGSPSFCPLHGDINKANLNQPEHSDYTDNDMSRKISHKDCSTPHNHSGPCPVHGDVLSYLSTPSSSTYTTVYYPPDVNSTVYSKSPGEYILRVSSSNPTSIMTTGPLLEDNKYLSTVADTSSFSFSTAI